MPVKKKIKRESGFKDSVKPRSFYVELAEMGVLEDFLKRYMIDIYETDENFKNEMQEIIYAHSPTPSLELEILYLNKLCETIGYFLEYTRLWRN